MANTHQSLLELLPWHVAMAQVLFCFCFCSSSGGGGGGGEGGE